jgi:hypothetical protein
MKLRGRTRQTSAVLSPGLQWSYWRPQSGSALPATPLLVNLSPRRLHDPPVPPALPLQRLQPGHALTFQSP